MTPLWRRMLVLVALTAAAWLVHVFGRTFPTAAMAAVWVGLAVPIALGLARRGRIRRSAYLSAYFRAASPFTRWWRGRWSIPAGAALIAAALALFLGVALVRLDDSAAWIVLVAGGLSAAVVFALAERVLAGHVSARYLPEPAWRVTFAVVGASMLLALVALAFHRPHPDLGSVSLDRAVWHFVDQERARSAVAEILLQLAAVKDGLRLWLAQQLMPEPGGSLAQGLGWLVVLAEEAVFVWSYLLFLCPVLVGSKTDDESADVRE